MPKLPKAINRFDGRFYFLSNFYEGQPFMWRHRFTGKLVEVATGEHAFQAEKAAREDDYNLILFATSPGIAKRLGRRKTMPMVVRWDEVPYGKKHPFKRLVMRRVIHAKFTVPIMAEALIETDPAELIEGNEWHDNTWGNCTCAKCADLEGTNWLGLDLVRLRAKKIKLGANP